MHPCAENLDLYYALNMLQSLVDVAMSDVGMGEDAGGRDGSLYANGQVWQILGICIIVVHLEE